MNKLMGPEGALGKGQRDKYLHGNQEEHDALVSNIGNKPFGGQNAASKAYFGSAGIGGAGPASNTSPYQKKQAPNPQPEPDNEEDEFWYQGPEGGQGGKNNSNYFNY